MFRRCQFTVSTSFQFAASCLFSETILYCSQKSHAHIFYQTRICFPRADISCLLKLLASVQKGILLENSHMQKGTCRTWSYKSHQSKGSIKVSQMWSWEPDTMWEVKSQSKKARWGRNEVQLHNPFFFCLFFFFNTVSIKCTQSAPFPETETEIYVFWPLLVWS